MRICLNQSCFPGLSTPQFLEAVARAGGTRQAAGEPVPGRGQAPSVELRLAGHQEPVRDIVAAARATGLRVEAVNPLMDWALPDDPDPRPQLETLLEVAAATGASVIVCVAPLRYGALPPATEVARSAGERLAELSALTRPAGVRLALEQVGLSTSRPGATSGIRRLSEALAIAQSAGRDVAVTLDSYNLATAGEALDGVRTVPRERIGIAQLVDRSPITGGRTLPGEGDLDLEGFVEALAATGYDGALSLEVFPAVPWPDPVAFARDALSRIRSLCQAAEARV
jgi:sugar phosphate isomerase/epimerase